MNVIWCFPLALAGVAALVIAIVDLCDWEDLDLSLKVANVFITILGVGTIALSMVLFAKYSNINQQDTNQQQITTMASKSMKPARPVAPAPLTEEQKKEQVLRYVAQQRNSIYQMALANIIQANPVGNTGGDAYEVYADKVTALAKDIADKSIAILFAVDEKKEAAE